MKLTFSEFVVQCTDPGCIGLLPSKWVQSVKGKMLLPFGQGGAART